uniref:C-type lectin domain-containing protein n=1 Tax=Xiphophorus maculatus TaxID=8083 RepID=A0A3B5PZ71_XIPMA
MLTVSYCRHLLNISCLQRLNIFTVFLYSFHAVISLSCPSGWTLINSRCFQYVQKSITWARAERNCLSMGANLASVQDLNEYNQIQIIVTAAGHGAKQAWIGGTNAQENPSMLYYFTFVWKPRKPK